jgi:hypothetical protein
LQLRWATLGKIFPAQVFPALPSVVARGARQRKFFLKIKNGLCRRPLPRALGTGYFFKKSRKTIFADGLFQEPSAQNFLKKYKNPPSLSTAGREAVGKEDFKKPST